MKLRTRKDFRARRHMRVRRKVRGTAERPRLAVALTGKHIYVQLIDDEAAVTLASASTVGAASTTENSVAGARELGRQAATAATAKGIAAAVFDRGGNTYTGRVQAICEGAREGGLTI